MSRLTRKRVAIGGLYQESHSFSPAPATMDEFEACIHVRGAEMFERLAPMNHEVAGALEILTDCECIPLLYGATAASGMPLRKQCYRALKAEYLALVRAALPLDGIVMTMHGAMAAEHIDDATGDLIAAVREIVGHTTAITVSLDLHANVTRQMAAFADALVGYHTAPHIDQKDTGTRAARVMMHLLDGGSVEQAHVRIPMILPAENGQTTAGPFSEVMDLALELETRPDILSASAFSVQPWLDLAEVGSSVVIVTVGDARMAKQEANCLAREFWNRRSAFTPELMPYEQAIDRALSSDRRPFVFSDSSDAPSSGAPGDSTVLLSALLDRNVQDPVYLNMVDPTAVERAIEVGVGFSGEVTIGASLTDRFYTPVTFKGTVKTLFDGAFTFKGPGFNGVTFDMGRAAVWVVGGIHIVTMERGVLQWDPELYRCVGLEPTDARIVVAKSPAAFRAAYTELAHEIINIDAPGVCSPNLRAFPWRRVPRPIYPLDEFETSPVVESES